MRFRLVALATALLAAAAVPAGATPANKKALADYFGPLLPAKLNDCGTCHATRPGEPKLNPQLSMPHNPFGARLMAIKAELEKARRTPDLPRRLEAIAKEDTDGDGAPNLAELLTGHQPGAVKDRPTPAESAKAPALLAALRNRHSGYAWRPFEPVTQPPVPTIRNSQFAIPNSPSRPPAAAPLRAPGTIRNPVDAFILAKLQAKGLRPNPEAPKDVLLRRVYLDLTGIPPTREELLAFRADRSPNAYEKVVDRLLASPRYGERWGRHWMDVWRYSDWDGYGNEVRNSKPHMWRWRDWIVDSLNADKGYDQMLREMLAADEIAPEDPNVLPATGFIARNWYVFSRPETLNKLIEGTSKGFLGVTLNCARCHDHKFDALSQKEYFAFRAFFEPHDVRLERLPGQPDVNQDGIARAFDANPDAKTVVLLKGDDRKPDPNQPVTPAVPALLGGPPLSIQPVKLPLAAYAPDKRPFVIEETLAAADKAAKEASLKLGVARNGLADAEQTLSRSPQPSPEARAGAAAARQELELAELTAAAAEQRAAALRAVLRVEQLEDAGGKEKEPETWRQAATAAALAQRQQALADARLARLTAQRALAVLEAAPVKKDAELAAARTKLAEAEKQLAQAEQAVQQPPTTEYAKRPVQVFPAVSSGRRLALARWITDRQNPLCARVAINHIWLRHFGKPLVSTVFDFGANGRAPTHPELLDWLAAELMRRGWSMKAMHRLLVTSATYRQSSNCGLPIADCGLGGTRGANAKADGVVGNRTTSGSKPVRSNPQSAICNPQSIDPENTYLWRWSSHRMEAEVIRDSLLACAGQLDLAMGGPELDQNLGLKSRRRSLYFRHSVEKTVPLLTTFDQASVAECYERAETVMPQQALALANSEVAIGQSRLLATALTKSLGSDPPSQASVKFVVAAFQQILGRDPTPQERAECTRFLETQAARLQDPQRLTRFDAGAANTVPPSSDPVLRARENLVLVLFNHNDFITIR
jgi:hypothetical protein